MMKKVRLQKYLAEKGIDSRRNCEILITQGKIKVNHLVVTALGTRIDPAKDLVEYNHQIIDPDRGEKIYLIMNKPKGYLCTYRDPFGRPTIYDLLKNIETRINYAGRLDFNSEGLVLLSNDGDLIHQLTHPSKRLKKVYLVKIGGTPSCTAIKRLEQGIPLSRYFTTSPCRVRIVKKNPRSTILEITIREGKKRQIRRMFSSIGFSVLRLKRIKEDEISLGNLKPGQYRFLNKQEVEKLKNKPDVERMKGEYSGMSINQLIIAIDGPAGAGKSTVAMLVAEHLRYRYINTGDLYRYITYRALQEEIDVQSSVAMEAFSKNIVEQLLKDDCWKNDIKPVFFRNKSILEKIHSPEIDKKVSFVAQQPSVRENLVPLQRLLAKSGSVVMEGRDIGSVILPDADLKFFLTADKQSRIIRRYKELQEKGYDISLREVREEIIKRDKIDSKRKIAPLTKARDAITIDTSNKNIENVLDIILNKIRKYQRKNES